MMAGRVRCRMGVLLAVLMFGCAEKQKPVPKPAVPKTTQTRPSNSDADPLASLLEVGDAKSAQSMQTQLRFRDAAASVGARFQRFNDAVPQRYFLPEVMGGGVAWLDFDGDGNLDLFATNGCPLWDSELATQSHPNQLFRNRGSGQFGAVTILPSANRQRFGQGCAVGDFNSDGFPDLYITNYGENQLLINLGDGTWSDVTIATATGDESWGTSAVWLDANNDQLADLYVVNYLNVTRANHQVCTYGGVQGYCGPGHWDGVSDILYLNQGDGQFERTTPCDTVDTRLAKGLAVVVCDFDADSQPEIYVGNDMAPNQLLTKTLPPKTDRTSLYRNVAEAAGCAVSGDGRNEASMGVACSDFDNDGRVDIFLTHYFQHKNTLYRNLDSLLFEDNSRRTRVAATSFETLGFGTVAADFDHDGDDDLFIANGHVLGPEHKPNAMKPQLLENDGHGMFTDLSHQIGGYFDQRCVGRSAARGDYDNDGRVDLAVSHIDRPMAILRNETQLPHHFIGLQLLPFDRVLPAGGTVRVSINSEDRIIPIVGGGSYLASSDPRIVVGLGEHDEVANITVAWPGRDVESFDLTTDQYWLIREGKSKQGSLLYVCP